MSVRKKRLGSIKNRRGINCSSEASYFGVRSPKGRRLTFGGLSLVLVLLLFGLTGSVKAQCTLSECPASGGCCCGGAAGDSCWVGCTCSVCPNCAACGSAPDGGCYACMEGCPTFPDICSCEYCNGIRCEAWGGVSPAYCVSNCGGINDCFTPDTPIKTPEGEEPIINLDEGEAVASFDPETGSPSTGLIRKTFEYTRNAYFKIRTKDGRELKVTGTHPLLAIQKNQVPLSFWEYLKTESFARKFLARIFE